MRAGPQPARGAVLIVTLVMLTLVTLLTSAAMRTARDEVVRAAGREFIDDAYEAAEAGLASALRQPAYDTTRAVTLAPPTTVNGNRIVTTLRFIGRTAAIPHAAWRPTQHATHAAYHFEAVATARGPRRTVAVHRQQFYLIAPAANPVPASIPVAGPNLPGLPRGPVRTVWRSGEAPP